MDLLCFCSVLCFMFCTRLFICVLWSPAGKGLTSWLSFVVSTVSLSLSLGILGQVWYLFVSIPDLCTLTYFVCPWSSDSNLFIDELLAVLAKTLRVSYTDGFSLKV